MRPLIRLNLLATNNATRQASLGLSRKFALAERRATQNKRK
jgi:hypothetical protein